MPPFKKVAFFGIEVRLLFKYQLIAYFITNKKTLKKA